MIDIFNETFDALVGVLANYTQATIETSSEHVNMPTKFPFVSMEEINNSVYLRGMDDEEIENFSDIDFEINIFTQNPFRKTRAKEILQIVDTFFKETGFIRTSKNDFQDNNETTYRIIVRYNGVVSKDHTVYRR